MKYPIGFFVIIINILQILYQITSSSHIACTSCTVLLSAIILEKLYLEIWMLWDL